MSKETTKYAFILGHVPDLSVAEIICLLKKQTVDFEEILQSKEALIIEANQELDVLALQNRLGGVIKIIAILSKTSKENLSENIEEIVKASAYAKASADKQKFQFGFSLYGKTVVKEFQQLGLTIKRELKEQGTLCRFVVSKEKSLSAVIIKKEHLLGQGLDLVVIENQGEYYLGETLAIQDFEAYSARDYGRPSRDDKSGMLPPKLAQIMINLAGAKPADVLLDSFCGSGTVLQEALMLGYKNIIGSDISAKAIADCRNNISWLKTKYNFKIDGVKMYELDVRNLVHKVALATVDAIVTEPYLGEPDKSKLKTQKFEDLENLYLDSFKQFYKVLKSGGKAVMILPIINGQKMEILDAVQKIGFIIDKLGQSERGSIIYGREGQMVEREIFVFVKN
ncbi:MAG: DNA methyltransferase [Candidatus Komeilibacteria bacterium]|nr:DNA methyltransferase [Candidatus Komeilibacteria bacterium]